jgi:hypothetical protein
MRKWRLFASPSDFFEDCRMTTLRLTFAVGKIAIARELILSIAIFTGLAAAQTYNTPTNVSPIPYPTTIPCPSTIVPSCSGALTGAGWIYTEPSFPNTTLLRVTDRHTPSIEPVPSWVADCGGSAEVSLFSKNDDRIALCETGNEVQMFQLTWPTAPKLYGTNCILSGNPALCANNFFFSRVTNHIGYNVAVSCSTWPNGCSSNSTGDLTIYEQDVSSTSNRPTLDAGTITPLIDLSTCVSTLAGLVSDAWYDGVTVSNDDQTFATAVSTTPGQDNTNAVYVVVWNRSLGCRVWNTHTGAVTGAYGGAPIGTISIGDRFTIHNARLGNGGTWIKVACAENTCTRANYFWNIATLNVTTENETNGCGHSAIGYSEAVNNCPFNQYPPQAFFSRPMSNPSSYASLPSTYPTDCSPFDGCSCYMGEDCVRFDQHMTWPQQTGSDTAPFFSTTWVSYYGGYDGLPATNAWDGEGLAVSTNNPGAGVVYRLFHLFNTMQSSNFFAQYGVGACDANYCIWATDWDGKFGNTDGTDEACTITENCRVDVMLAKLPIN